MSSLFMVRELILFSADLTQTAWYQTGAAPPQPTVPGVSFAVVSQEWPEAVSLPSDVPELEHPGDRLHRGDTGIIATADDSGAVVYCLWLSDHPTFIDWIFKEIAPLPGHSLIYNAWVHPDWRGSPLHWARAAQACAELVKRERPHLVAGVELDEFKPFATKYAQMGLALIEPQPSVWGVKVFGAAFHFNRGIRRSLATIAGELRTRHADLYPGAS